MLIRALCKVFPVWKKAGMRGVSKMAVFPSFCHEEGGCCLVLPCAGQPARFVSGVCPVVRMRVYPLGKTAPERECPQRLRLTASFLYRFQTNIAAFLLSALNKFVSLYAKLLTPLLLCKKRLSFLILAHRPRS